MWAETSVKQVTWMKKELMRISEEWVWMCWPSGPHNWSMIFFLLQVSYTCIIDVAFWFRHHYPLTTQHKWFVEISSENQQLTLSAESCLSLAIDAFVNLWVFYSHRGQEKNLCFRRSNYKSWSVTSFSHVLLWVLHLTKVYRILALGIGNMEIKESRQCSLGPQDFDAIASTQWSLQWPWAPSLESAPGLSTIAPSQSRTVPLCAVLPAWRWVTQHTGVAVWRRMEWLHIR